jgi:thioredoxin reductase (NADPH)
MKHQVIIIGGGPAGYTAAIYTARAAMSPLVIAGYASGGQLMSTTEVENFPGFAHGIQGPELMAAMRAQAERFGATILDEDATAVDLSTPGRHRVATDSGVFEAPAVIVATGASARRLGIPGEDSFMGRGVATCAVCDGNHFRGQRVVVSGGGDSALEEVLQLSRIAAEIVLVVRGGQLRASKAMQERVFALDNVRVRYHTEVVEVLGERRLRALRLRALRLRDNITGREALEAYDGLFVAIGHRPNTGFLEGQLPLSAEGYAQTRDGESATAVPGVFVAGDVYDYKYRQAITAAASGCRAALDAERYLTVEAPALVATGAA